MSCPTLLLLALTVTLTSAAFHSRYARQQLVGSPCLQSVECSSGTGMYCNSQRQCDCLPTYTPRDGFCFRKINPGQSGCQFNEQCTAVSQESVCSSGTCDCQNGQPPMLTRDGYVCVNYGQCPTGSNTEYPEGQCGGGGAATDVLCDETYDCICTDPNCNQNGICCPGRAYTCILPSDSGSGGSFTTSRWFYNGASGQCETFTYFGSNGNANNFFSKSQCETWCLTTCSRGGPQEGTTLTTSATGKASFYPPRTCSVSGGSFNCNNNFECKNFQGGQHYCCPTVGSVCSRLGGRTYSGGGVPFNTNFDPGETWPSTSVTSSRNLQRWYFDEGSQSCRSFTWTGLGGNYNNFPTQNACESYCASRVCSIGTPLQDASGSNQACSVGCSNGYTCESNVCCPTKQTVCNFPKEPGSPACFQYAQRWWFNSATGTCEQFQYNGCQGNDNNFATFIDCSTSCTDISPRPTCLNGDAYADSSGNYYICQGTGATVTFCPSSYECRYDGNVYGCCPTRDATCNSNFDQGTSCKATVTRWYFDSGLNTCNSFSYFGCDGNPNNFASKRDCEKFCQTGGCPYGGTAQTLGGSFLTCGPSQQGSIFGGTTTGTCATGYFCTPLTRLVNGLTTTAQNCCPTRAFTCSQPLRNLGTVCSTTTIVRNTRTCEQYTDGGCGDANNGNNFATREECYNYCYGADCAPGEAALISTTTNFLTQCANVGGQCSGSTGYTCRSSTLLSQSICCGTSSAVGTCLGGQSPWVDPYTARELSCTTGVFNTCPGGYTCQYSSIRQAYYCCGFSSGGLCPSGGTPFLSGFQPVPCNPTLANSCTVYGAGLVCESSTVQVGVTSLTGTCCQPTVSNSVCGTAYKPRYTSTNPTTPVQCNPVTADVCTPVGSRCIQAPLSPGIYYCCDSTGVVPVTAQVCPTGYTSQKGADNLPIICTTTGAAACVSPYQCLQSPLNALLYCCSQGGGVSTTTCGNGQPYLTGTLNACSPSPNSCTTGYGCQFIAGAGGYACCPGAFVQPTAFPTQPPVAADPCYAPYRSPNAAAPNACSSTAQCPTNFFCVQGRTGSYCCGTGVTVVTSPPVVTNPGSSDVQGCPAGMMYIPFPTTTLPIACTTGSVCPNGGQCRQSSRAGVGQICCR